jgi:hypothetical protein
MIKTLAHNSLTQRPLLTHSGIAFTLSRQPFPSLLQDRSLAAGEQPFERSQTEPGPRFNWLKQQIPTRQESALCWLALPLHTVELWFDLSLLLLSHWLCPLLLLFLLLLQALQTVFSHLQVCDKSVGTYTNTTSNYGPAGTRPQNAVSRPPSYPPASLASYQVRFACSLPLLTHSLSPQQQSYYPASAYPQAYSGGRAAAPTGMPGMPSHGQQYGYPSANGQVGKRGPSVSL